MSKQKWLTTAAGVKMPPMIFGTAWKKEQTADLVKQALVAGFRGIDTACQPRHYNEALVGQAVRDAKSQGIDRSDINLNLVLPTTKTFYLLCLIYLQEMNTSLIIIF